LITINVNITPLIKDIINKLNFSERTNMYYYFTEKIYKFSYNKDYD